MTHEEIVKLVDGDPYVLISTAEKLGIDLGHLDEDIAKNIVKERFSITDEQIKAVDFVFWIAYFVEREAETLITSPEVHIGARETATETIVSKLHFGDKIKIIEELYTGKKSEFTKLMRKIQNMRNDVAHGRFENLKYGGYHLSDNRGKLILIADLRDVTRKKTWFL